jgi:site-specific DNA recombinase
MKCGIIVRVSGPKQKENWSVGSQRKLGIEYARSQNWDYELYDEVASAKNIEGREQFSKLINDIQDKGIHAVWAVEFQRITRDDEDTAFFKKLCIEYNVRIIILNEEIKFSTPEDEMFFTIRGAVSKYERRKTIERVKRAHIQKKDSGKVRHTHQFGYKRNADGSVTVDKAQAEIVKLVFEMFNSGASYPSICKRLSKDGIPRYHGSKEWYVSQIMNIVKNPVFIGKTRDSDGNPIKSEIYKVPIISEQDFEIAQLRLKHSYEKDVPKNRVSKYELSGLITCAKCGRKYFGSDNSYRHVRNSFVDTHNCITTKKQIPSQFVERLTMAVIGDILSKYQTTEKLYKALNPKKEVKVDKSKILEIGKLREKRQKVVNLVIDEIITKIDAKKKLTELDKEIKQLEVEVAEIQEPKDFTAILDAFADKTAFELWILTPQERKEIYKEIIECIQINDETKRILFLIAGVGCYINYENPEDKWLNRLDIVDTYYRVVQ